jgi:hypothetical protein
VRDCKGSCGWVCQCQLGRRSVLFVEMVSEPQLPQCMERESMSDVLAVVGNLGHQVMVALHAGWRHHRCLWYRGRHVPASPDRLNHSVSRGPVVRCHLAFTRWRSALKCIGCWQILRRFFTDSELHAGFAEGFGQCRRFAKRGGDLGCADYVRVKSNSATVSF